MKRAHIDHRLDSRATPAAAERGFSLLRDRQALAAFIAALTTTRADLVDADRLAFALGPGDRCAHAIVARDGGGVTCLGPDMPFAAPRVAWPVVELFLRQQHELLQARRALQSVKELDDDVSPLMRLVRHPQRMVRREWDLLRALLPIIGVQWFTQNVLVALELVVRSVFARRRPPTDEMAQDLWRIYATAAVSVTLVGDQRGATETLLSTVLCGDLILAARGTWYLANQPEGTLAFASAVADVDVVDDQQQLLRLALGIVLPAVGFRCPAYFKEAERLRARLGTGEAMDEAAGRRDVERRTVAFAPLLLLPFRAPLEAVTDDGSVARVFDADGAADVAALLAVAGRWHVDIFRIWRPFAQEREPPRLAPRPPSSSTDDDDASQTLWRSVLRHPPVSLALHAWAAKLVTLAPIEALVPRDVPDAEWRLKEGALYLQTELESVVLPPEVRAAMPRSEPVRAEKKPEPNGPCPCGSGKKWKKCHGKA